MADNTATMVLTKEPKSKIKVLTFNAMFIALTLIFTKFINIQFPATMGGLIHLGNIPMFIAAMLFGKRTGAIAGGIGMGLFDLLGGWVAYAPCTLIVVGLMGFSVGAINEKSNKTWVRIAAMVLACAIKVAGYYVFECFYYGSAVVPLASIPGNITQVVIAAVIVMLIIKPLEKAVSFVR